MSGFHSATVPTIDVDPERENRRERKRRKQREGIAQEESHYDDKLARGVDTIASPFTFF